MNNFEVFEAKKIEILLQQHIGNPCKPIVAVGDKVKRGQLIAVPNGLGANIHASLSGEISEITTEKIVISLDKKQNSDYVKLEKTDNHIEKIISAGIVGLGGAGFPTGVKFSAKINDGYIIANAAECEPMLTHNTKFLEDHADVLVRGLKYMLETTGAKKAYIAIKSKYRKALLAVGKACKYEPSVEVKILSDMYPAGDERVVIREVLGHVLELGQLPLEINTIVSNVETFKRIVEAIEDDKPMIDKDLTVSGRVKNENTILFDMPIGLPVKEFIDIAGGYVSPYGEIVNGGPFTGSSTTEDAPITKTTGSLLVAMPYPTGKKKVGILICECGAEEERLREIAEGMNSEVVSVHMCKRMKLVNGRYRCELPGICPGQAEKILKMKKDGADAVITGTCEDWTNTVTGVAPRLGVAVYHSTDHVLRSVGHKLYRSLNIKDR